MILPSDSAMMKKTVREKGISTFMLNTDITDSKQIFHIEVDVVECGKITCGLIFQLFYEEELWAYASQKNIFQI